jgi:hypothetical protein
MSKLSTVAMITASTGRSVVTAVRRAEPFVLPLPSHSAVLRFDATRKPAPASW